jgi:hypothetical protein
MSNQSENVSPLAASAYAPGRVELLGNHTDYNEGVVLGAAIDRGLTVHGRKRDDGLISIESSTMGHVEIARSALRPLEENRWANYALGVANELIALSIPVEGFSAEVSGDLTAGCGLSSWLRSNWRPLCFYSSFTGANLARSKLRRRVSAPSTASLVYDRACSTKSLHSLAALITPCSSIVGAKKCGRFRSLKD